MKRTVWAIVVLLLSISLTAQTGNPLGSFQYERSIDPVTDEDTSIISTHDNSGHTLVWSCREGHLQVTFLYEEYVLPDRYNSVKARYRFDQTPAEPERDWFGTVARTASMRAPSEAESFTSKALAAQTLVLRVSGINDSATATFKLDGLGSALSTLPCGLPVPVPYTSTPTIIEYVEPAYPSIAQSARVQGAVIMEVKVGPSGKVVDARVLRSIPLLDQAALNAVRQWEFTPTVVDGVAGPITTKVTLRFTLPPKVSVLDARGNIIGTVELPVSKGAPSTGKGAAPSSAVTTPPNDATTAASLVFLPTAEVEKRLGPPFSRTPDSWTYRAFDDFQPYLLVLSVNPSGMVIRASPDDFAIRRLKE